MEKKTQPVNGKFLKSSFASLFAEKETFKQISPAAYEEQKMLIQKVKKSSSVDVLFIMDCTGSMKKYMDQAKTTIIDIIKKVQQCFQGFTFRVGFVAYRDLHDKRYPNIEYIDFTTRIEAVQDFVGKVQALSGQDCAEDVIGGLNAGLKLKSNANLLCCFFIADAPSHGSQYHRRSSSYDYLADKIPENALENVLEQYKKMANVVEFTCLKITDDTDIMFQKMQKVLPNLTIQKIDSALKFADIVTSTIVHHASNHDKQIIKNVIKPISGEGLTTKATFWQVILPPIPKDALQIDETFLKEFGKKLRFVEESCTIKILKDELGKGACSIAHKIHDVTRDRKMVGKVPINFLTQEDGLKVVKDRIITQAYSCFFAQYYRCVTALDQLQAAPPIFVLPPSYYVLDEPFKGIKHIYAEPELNYNEQWARYSNNSAFCASQTMASFSHFTWVASQKYLMVTDLQGKGFILTDPAIHSDDSNVFSESTNKGQEGFVSFFMQQHPECSDQVCHPIGLD
ncbi:hypothetical protein FGO68_gene9920 [Halteria grandinella]|uniref:Alpha-type protein kinase domain-containing protein n=1 Tax=Halteria grandinella TaxID=5974 RepID=A0A8J8T6U1_HALGN|nr:hypothetical protein FGO68_gene9920 [Halteria grandinella]